MGRRQKAELSLPHSTASGSERVVLMMTYCLLPTAFCLLPSAFRLLSCYNRDRPPTKNPSEESEKTLSLDVVNCPRCSRRTAAARGACIYCGESLPVTKIEAAPPQRNIDSFERAFNTVLESAGARADESVVAALAAALKIELDEAKGYVYSGKRLPLARSQNRQEAEMIAALVRTCGLGAVVVGDDELRIERELARARKITLAEASLQAHHSGGVMDVALADIKLLVIGALKTSRVDYTEGLTGIRSQSSNVLDTAEYRSDETMVDVYCATIESSFRIRSDGFDYSGLVSPLSFRADENLRAAIRALGVAAPQAAVDDGFHRVGGLLARAWPERTRNEAHGIKRKGLAYRPVARSSVVSDNRDQFDRYSRLMFLYARNQ
ncbi:MAG TPA: hypothetical protein VJZ26_11615 [Blastocatellia bacterium]|nr:hypothetical protein [Blastocatellia bacterium]